MPSTDPARSRYFPLLPRRPANHIRSLATQASSFLLLLAAFIFLSACGMGFGEVAFTPRELQPAKDLLIRGQPEEEGYGLYSYLLFESPPTEEYQKLYLSAIWAMVQEIPDLAEQVRNYAPKRINLTYIPVIQSIQSPPQGRSQKDTLKWWSEEILKHYDYERARTILNQSEIPKRQRRGGPYLLSTPVSATGISAPPEYYLFQDLSPIPPDRPQLAFEWVLDFVDRASVPQSSGWDRKTLVKFGQDLRASRANSRLSQEAGLKDAEIKQLISIPRKGRAEESGYLECASYLIEKQERSGNTHPH